MNLLKIALSIVAIAGLGTTVYGLARQTDVQQQMNDTMNAIDHSLMTAGAATQKTTRVLAPLTQTTAALADIEQEEKQTVADLASMNTHLSHINQNEQSIVNSLGPLNKSTSGASALLTQISSLNGRLLSTSVQSANQAAVEAQQVGNLNQMSTTSIQQISTLNHKLASLKALP